MFKLTVNPDKSKITALKWSELSKEEQNRVINLNIDVTKVSFDSIKAFTSLLASPIYYFDKLGNIYTHIE